MPIWIKYLVSAGLIVLISETAKRSDRLGAFIGAMPWVTVMAMIWLFAENQGKEKIAAHAFYTFWFVIPTLPMFLLMPALLQRGWSFVPTLAAGLALTAALFGLFGLILKSFGISLW